MTDLNNETVIKIKRASSTTWTSLNFFLEEGELGLELDTRRIKIGNGLDLWNDLPYSIKQVDNILLDGNSMFAEGDLELRPLDGNVFVYSDLLVDGDLYSSDKRIATEDYVNSVKRALDVKDSVRVATTSSLTLAGLQVVDGIQLSQGDRVLVKNQNPKTENGIYEADQGIWKRSEDANSNAEVTSGMFVFVEDGVTNPNSGWVLTSEFPILLGGSDIEFSQFSGAGQVIAGNGLEKTGNKIDVVGAEGRIIVGENNIDISPDYEGQSSISVLGIVSTGSWEANAVVVKYGGTGITEFSKGDILYASDTDELVRLPAGGINSFLKINSDGVPEWFSSIDGGTP